jgi:hypothetical protein
MRLTTIIGTAIAAVGLAACSSTVVPTARPATPTPIVTTAPSATTTATPTAPPTPTPTPTTPGVYVTVTCSNVPVMWAQKPIPPGSILGIATWHNLTMGDDFGIGLDLSHMVTSPTMSIGVEGIANNAFQQGNWGWGEVSITDGEAVVVAQGSLTIPACAPNVRVTACDHAGTASGGAISWSDLAYSTLTVTGPTPSTYHFTLPASAGRYGPLTEGTYSYTFNAYGESAGGAFTIPACTG